jgi:AcrR family transcriptional regulator
MSASTAMAAKARQGSGTRKLSAQAEARRDEILEAALFVISRSGFHHTSMAAIATRAGVSRAAVYQYFTDKGDILLALADRVAARIIEAVDGWASLPVAGGESSEEGARSIEAELRHMVDVRVAQILVAISANVDAARLIVRLRRTNTGPATGALRRIDEHVVAVLARDIETGRGFGWARTCDARMISRFLLGGFEKMVIDALEREEPLDLDVKTISDEIAALVFYGLVHPDLLEPFDPSLPPPAGPGDSALQANPAR